MYFDVESTPVLNSVTVYGTLIWVNSKTDASLTMNTKIMFNRGGTIQVGNKENPFIGELAQIRLHGDKFSP